MLDDDHGIALLHELVEDLQEPSDVGEVQPRRGLVQDVERPARGAATQLGGELDPLGLAPRQGGRGLAEANIVEPHVVERAELLLDGGHGLEKQERLRHRHREDLRDVLTLVAHLERLAVVTLRLADLAGDVDVRQEVHLDLDEPVALTGLAASALDVEREASGLIAAHPRVGRPGHERPDQGEDAGICGGVGAGGAPDRGLVDVDDLVVDVDALDRIVLARLRACPMQLVRERLVDDLVHERRLAGSGDTGHDHELAHRKLDIDVLQVVLGGASHPERTEVIVPTLGHGDLPPVREELARDGVLVPLDLRGGPLGDHVSPVLAGAGAHVDEPVGGTHHLLVVLDDEHRVAEVSKSLERPDQLVVVPLVETDRRLVQDVEDAD